MVCGTVFQVAKEVKRVRGLPALPNLKTPVDIAGRKTCEYIWWSDTHINARSGLRAQRA